MELTEEEIALVKSHREQKKAAKAKDTYYKAKVKEDIVIGVGWFVDDIKSLLSTEFEEYENYCDNSELKSVFVNEYEAVLSKISQKYDRYLKDNTVKKDTEIIIIEDAAEHTEYFTIDKDDIYFIYENPERFITKPTKVTKKQIQNFLVEIGRD